MLDRLVADPPRLLRGPVYVVGRSRHVRSRGLPRKRGMERKCGIMRVVIRSLLVIAGTGEWPAKALSPVLGWDVLIALAAACLRQPSLRVLNTEKRTQLSPLYRRLPVCVSASASRVELGQALVLLCVPCGDRTIVLRLQPTSGVEASQLFFSGHNFRRAAASLHRLYLLGARGGRAGIIMIPTSSR